LDRTDIIHVPKEAKSIAKISLASALISTSPAGVKIDSAWFDAWMAELSDKDRQRLMDFALEAFSNFRHAFDNKSFTGAR
jgi:hypothetical protein